MQKLIHMCKMLQTMQVLYRKQAVKNNNNMHLTALFYDPSDWVFLFGVTRMKVQIMPITITTIRVLCFKLEIEIQRIGEQDDNWT